VPLDVLMVTCAEVAPAGAGGTVTVHTSSDEQLVAVTCPLKEATMLPSELRKFEPVAVIVWPGLAEAGVSDEMCGGAPGVDGAEVVLVVDPSARPGWVVGAVFGGGPPVPRVVDTARATRVATTRMASTTTAAGSQRAGSLSDRIAAGERGAPVRS
jgi:hypothetical protein